jgi:enoyl-CoA hydratase
MPVRIEKREHVTTVILSRPEVRNAIDAVAARELYDAACAFDEDADGRVLVLWGEGGHFCAGADLKAIARGEPNRVAADGPGPLGPTRLLMKKPVIAAVAGYAVAGGLELACWADLRVVEESATFGVYCRRVGVPLIDGGTVRLPRLIGASRALDLILTGRPVGAREALEMGLANRVVPDGESRAAAESLAAELAALPQICMRNDRLSVHEQWSLALPDAMANELAHGIDTLSLGEWAEGAKHFAKS